MRSARPTTNKGNHGFDNAGENMHAVLIANGPSFKKNYVSRKSVKQVDVYNLLARTLKIRPSPNNGTFANISDLFL
jgi:hypothetical protein